MKFRDFIRILTRYGFELDRQSGTSHRVYKGRIGGQNETRGRRLPQRERRHQARHTVLDDPAAATAQARLRRMSASSGQRHRKLMASSVAITVREQPAQRMGQELEPDRERSRAMEQSALFLWRQVRDTCEIQRNRLLERAEHLFEGAALDRYVEIEADRLPLAIPAFGIAAQTSGRQYCTFRT